MSTVKPSTPVHDYPVTREALKRDWSIPYCNAHLLRLEREGKFPRRIYLGGRTAAWLTSELAAWVASFVAARDAKATR
ncbi:AlpA family phage regulatory protein [Luteibacter pinisoli]|uniref:AlpA family phage regulatory protein n=1 Tax=Luteibacter pinisoli TaxID=2589080 RepID=A0A4Y5Z1A3_9GAMM|nr:AlpA family phage regulatory protein [Luteibacter pinisoli]QDE38445.1 AlpA family phage regulatory protein [Luteibacter pinisoli]